MSLSATILDGSDLHPIDVAEHVASQHEWEFDRVAEDQMAMELTGRWASYGITLAWCAGDETLRLLLTFDMEPPPDRLPALYELINAVNDRCWAGAFAWWGEEGVMTFRYGLMLAGDQIAAPEQIDMMIHAALMSAERFFPAFQLVLWDNQSPQAALTCAIDEAYGRA
jgi:hypothetical protein